MNAEEIGTWNISRILRNWIICSKKYIKEKKEVCHTVALPFYIKKYLKGKRRIMKIQIFHHAKI
jgi:hypothetical protein